MVIPPTLPTTAPAIVAVAGLSSPIFDALVLFVVEEPLAEESRLTTPGIVVVVAGNNAVDVTLPDSLTGNSPPEGELVGIGNNAEPVIGNDGSIVGSDRFGVTIEGTGLAGGEEGFESRWLMPG
jgi:hypothetical protein